MKLESLAGEDSPGTRTPGCESWSTDIQVSRWQAGDAAAFRALYDRFAPLLKSRVTGRRRVWPMLNGRFQVEDVVQEIWTRVIPSVRKAFTPSGPGSFCAFLGRLADSTMVDMVRTLRAAKRGEDHAARPLSTNWEQEAVPKPGIAAVETPTSRARCSELETLARRALSDREHHAWLLVELHDYSAEEAGVAMRCTGSAVRGLLRRARARLVSRLGDED